MVYNEEQIKIDGVRYKRINLYVLKNKKCAFKKVISFSKYFYFYQTGQKPSGYDSVKWTRGSVSVRGPRLALNRAQKPGDAAPSIQLPLPRTEARRYRGKRRLYQKRMENVAESTQDFCFECE